MRPYSAPARRSAAWPARRLCPAVALEIGSSRTRAWMPGRGIVLDVPTVTFPGTGASYPVQRGTIVDPEGAARMLKRLLGHRTPRHPRPLIALTTPVLNGIAYRTAARTALEVLRPRTVLTIPTATAVALGTGTDTSRPLLIVDIGAHLTEVFLLVEGAVADAHRTTLGTDDLDGTTTYPDVVRVAAATVAGMLRQDRTTHTRDALRQGVLLAGGGALRPEFAHRLTAELRAPVRPVPAPHTAALRGAAEFLRTARRRPFATGSAGSPAQL